MIEVKCKKLYNINITINLLNEFYALGEAFGRKNITVEQIYSIKDISDRLKVSWLIQYNREWNESLIPILDCIREKAKLNNEKHLITYDLENKEIIVIDMLKKDYELLCEEHNYLVSLNVDDKSF